LNHRSAGIVIGHIALDDDGFGTGRAALGGDGFGAVGGLVVVDGHAAAGLGELEGGGGAHAARGAGDEGSFSRKFHAAGMLRAKVHRVNPNLIATGQSTRQNGCCRKNESCCSERGLFFAAGLGLIGPFFLVFGVTQKCPEHGPTEGASDGSLSGFSGHWAGEKHANVVA
jgi:hypothetical protein